MKWMLAISALVASASWIVSEGVARSEAPISEQLEMLTDEDIHRLIDGHELTAGAFPPPGAHANIERYCAGRFVFVGPLIPVGGTYEIANSQLCRRHSLSGETFCTRYFRDDSGAYFRQRMNDASPHPIEVRPATCE